MGETYAQAAVRDDLGESGGDRKSGFRSGRRCSGLCIRGGRGSRGEGDIKVALDELQIGRELAQESVDGGRGQVAQTENLANLARGEELLELCPWVSIVWRSKDRRDWSKGITGIPLRECPTFSAVSLAGSNVGAAGVWLCGLRLRGQE